MINPFKLMKNNLQSDMPPGGPHAITRLQTSFDVRITYQRVAQHKFTLSSDWHYILMASSLTFCFIIIESPNLLIRSIVALTLLLLMAMPISGQFFFPLMAILNWLILFYSPRFIPSAYRPQIFVRLLPALETILYGGNLSQALASNQSDVLDILAWIPYGLCHYGAPFVVSILLFVFAPPKTLPCFTFSFGFMNFFGVLIELLAPNAPPWYQYIHGLDPANYSMNGSAGGLARIDKLIGINLYSGSFGASPMVFGAFPSMHSGSAVMEALFLSHVFPKLTPLFTFYVAWIWWSTMYLTHHYFIDLTAGAIIAFTVYYLVRISWLPKTVPGKISRWSYDAVEIGYAGGPPKFRKSMEFDRNYIELPQINTSNSANTDTLFEEAHDLEYDIDIDQEVRELISNRTSLSDGDYQEPKLVR
ncbi:PAP2-domain-containing protein [Nadsonia fulvescens var. elongata DSM 6958]|uniref:PAP2-domain-containing protein n=1 Tax=Nadsonia fulvescens var. elongata DSM 6958 TaxID=857566 RepID=A0A1E3PUC1_9ASCO|nr:PAP2-domain-containing protein [Nadsonia fulvescens var. elongata DSM 6958]